MTHWKLPTALSVALCIILAACQPPADQSASHVHIVGAMKNVMWKGELAGIIQLDTISDPSGLYGIGPESYLRGELLIKDGKSYVSRVNADSTMTVEQTDEVSAPFFVYSRVTDWRQLELPGEIKTIADLEVFIDQQTKDDQRPFAFQLSGTVKQAVIHVQNLAPGTSVSSPKEAHQGQVNYALQETAVDMVGFFSKQHQGVFTHHDSYVHIHLITQDEQMMGHLDEVVFESMTLFLPAQ